MTENRWLDLIKTAQKVALIGNNTRKIHYKFSDGREMVDEYNLATGVLCKRAFKSDSICKDSKWDVEVGDAMPAMSEKQPNDVENIGILERKDSPYIVHRITKTKLEWRIYNLPYELDVYRVTVEPSEKCIVVRTTNKKYYKKITMLELQRLNLTPRQSDLHFSHSFKTLIITYEKPSELILFEKKIEEELKSVTVVDNADMDCKPS